MKEILKDVDRTIISLDIKNGTVAGIGSFLFYIILKMVVDSPMGMILTPYLMITLLLIGFAGLVGAFSFVPFSISGNKAGRSKLLESDNLMFYEDISKYTEEEFLSKLSQMDEFKDVVDKASGKQLAEIIIRKSRIAVAKQKYFAAASVLFLSAFIVPLFGLIITLVIPYLVR